MCFTTHLKNLNYQRDTIGLGYNSNKRKKSKGKQKVTLEFLSKIQDNQTNNDDDEDEPNELFVTIDKQEDVV